MSAVTYGTGNTIVDQMGQISITGDVTPRIWRQTITHEESGRPYTLAISILSDLVYWYKPREVVDERTGMVSRWQQRFSGGDLLARSYEQMAEMFGVCRRSVAYALKRLEDLGVIRRHVRTIAKTIDGVTAHLNMLFIELVPRVLRKLTYPGMPDPEGEGDTAPDVPSSQADEAQRDVERAATEMDGLAPRKAGFKRRRLASELASVCQELRRSPSDLVRAYRTYVSTPDFWPRGQKERMLRFALAWLLDRHLVSECLEHVSRADASAKRREEAVAMAAKSPADLARDARITRARDGRGGCWLAQVAGRYLLVAAPDDASEDDVRRSLAEQLREP